MANFPPSMPASYMAPDSTMTTPGLPDAILPLPTTASAGLLPPSKAGLTAPQKYRKAPDAPKRFKSAFIFYSAAKHREIKASKAHEGKVEKVCTFVRQKILATKPEAEQIRYLLEKILYNCTH
jgi:hypothetical protein